MINVQFEKGINAATYLSELKFYRSVVRKLVDAAEVNQDHVTKLKEAIQKYPQPVRAIAMTEDWCGDSACNVPILSKLFSGAGVPFLIFHGSEYKELEKYYNDMGIDHIPVISLWDGSGVEIGRWVEQPAAVLKMKNEWKAARPERSGPAGVKAHRSPVRRRENARGTCRRTESERRLPSTARVAL